MHTQCYIPSFKAVGQLLPEKKFFYAFIIYDMGVAAMLIICCRTFEQLFVHKGLEAVYEISLVSEEKSFEIVDSRRLTYDGRRSLPIL